MNRTDRLVGILMQLQRHKQRRAEDLAATFEVSVRTIYRDIQALCETGVPVIAMTGQGYSLPDEFFLPPVNFTVEEAFMLILGADYMAQNFDAHYADIAKSAKDKIHSVLPVQHHGDIEYLQNNIAIYTADSPNEDHKQRLKLLRQAIIQKRSIRMSYTTRFTSGQPSDATIRMVDPYSVAQYENKWFLYAYCHLRDDTRVFRLSRIHELQILLQTFERPHDLTQKWVRPDSARQLIIRVLAPWDIARWVEESPAYFTESTEETSDGLLITLRVAHERDVMQWLLSWGSKIEILEPEHVRNAVIAEAHAILEQYQKVKIPY